MSRFVIGEVEDVDLELHRNADTLFAVEWWANDAATDPVALASGHGTVRDSNMEGAAILLSLDPFVTITGNEANVVIPKSALVGLPAFVGVWDFVLVSTSGERRSVMEGNARLVRGSAR